MTPRILAAERVEAVRIFEASVSRPTLLTQQPAMSAKTRSVKDAWDFPNILVAGVFVVLMYAGVICYPVLQVWALWRLRGRQRWVAAAALAVMIPVYIISGFAYKNGSNLWPIWAILLSPLAGIYVGTILWNARARTSG